MGEHDHEHQRDHDDATRGRAAGANRGGAAVAADPSLLGLQQTAGNGAVTRMVLQRRTSAGDDAAVDHGEMVRRATAGGGRSLDATTRQEMEGHVGADLSAVRVHTGGEASEAAGALGAEAFTVGNDVVFSGGQFDPASDAGRHRLAHEVTHVVQQRSGPVSATDTGTGVALSDPSDAYEQAAEESARTFSRGRH